ncbi:staygreen family protein [Romboutsia weinsteinii]|uniref:staygreen family protein n=1 Tax=Romboutsia weinsteinii TaxID=2020949 RepID=UPI001314C6EF|nr:staygreen family protein [Romboutsia weinsteinii]
MLNVNIVKPLTSTGPILFRRYTLVHSENDNDLYLTIATQYGSDPIKYDEVYGQWAWVDGDVHVLTLFVLIGYESYEVSKARYELLLNKLPNDVSAIINGDCKFLEANQNLMDSHVSMRFISSHDDFNKTVYYCRVKEFIV